MSPLIFVQNSGNNKENGIYKKCGGLKNMQPTIDKSSDIRRFFT